MEFLHFHQTLGFLLRLQYHMYYNPGLHCYNWRLPRKRVMIHRYVHHLRRLQ